MTPLTKLQAFSYAVIPGLSSDFEKIAGELSPYTDPKSIIHIDHISPLSHARGMLLLSISAIALGIIGMMATGNHYKFVSMTMGGCILFVAAICMLYDAAAKVQAVWNSKSCEPNRT